MSNLAKLEFSPLDISGKNYMSWTIDFETHLDSMDLHETIIEGNTSSKVDKAKSLIFLRRHLDENLKNEYLNVKDPSDLWKNLKDRFDHQRIVMLPLYRDKWAALRFQNFAKVSDYNSEMIKIVSHLNFCGDETTDAEMMEKTLSTFHASNVTLQRQYRVRGFEKYHALMNEFTRLEESDFNNEHVDTVEDFTNANEINFIEHDPVNEYTHLGEHDPSEVFLGDITK
ncbi:unnamed protein product [Rhodiola kirilowii]